MAFSAGEPLGTETKRMTVDFYVLSPENRQYNVS